MYRPKGWKTLKAKNHPLHCFAPDDCVGQSFEAGASAMLEGLKKDGVPVLVNQSGGLNILPESLPYVLALMTSGKLVFIPEEK